MSDRGRVDATVPVAVSKAATEHKVEHDSGWLLDRATGKTTPWDGIRILWRFTGERKWRRIILVPDEAKGQTLAGLRDNVPEIVDALAERALPSVPAPQATPRKDSHE